MQNLFHFDRGSVLKIAQNIQCSENKDSKKAGSPKDTISEPWSLLRAESELSSDGQKQEASYDTVYPTRCVNADEHE